MICGEGNFIHKETLELVDIVPAQGVSADLSEDVTFGSRLFQSNQLKVAASIFGAIGGVAKADLAIVRTVQNRFDEAEALFAEVFPHLQGMRTE